MAREVLYRVCYGSSNLTDYPLAASLAASLVIKPAILHDFCRHRVKMADYPGIIAEKCHTVRGTYVTGLTENDIACLDRFEGSEYNRCKVKVEILTADGQRGEELETETYVFIAGTHCLEEKEWDYEVFRREKMHRWADHSDEYKG
jgi:hypothetical protein